MFLEALGVGATALGGLLSYQGQRETNASNAQQAAQQMAFQERMSGSAHQREVADLRAAGLNPILSGTGGAGSSTPPGAQAHMENANAAGMNSALATRMNLATVKNLAEQNKQIQADTDLKSTQRSYTSQLWNTSRADEELRNQQLETERHKTDAAKHEASILSNSAKGAVLEGDIDTTRYGEIMRYIDRAVRSITGGSSAIRNLGGK